MKSFYAILWFSILLLCLLKISTAAFAQSSADEISIKQVAVIQDDRLMNTPEDIKIVGGTLFISLRGEATDGDEYIRNHSGMTAWDIETPGKPKLKFKVEHPELNGAMDHILVGDILFLQSLYNATFLSIDLSDMRSPRFLDSLKLGSTETVAYRLFKIKSKDQIVVSMRKEKSTPTGQIATLDISNPQDIQLIDKETESNTWSYDNFAIENVVYSFPYMMGSKKLHIYEISPDGTLRFEKIFEHPLLDGVHSLKKGKLLYIANFGSSTILILNIEDPFNPIVVGELQDDRMGEPNRMALDEENGLLWVAGYRKDIISVLDVRKPSEPQFIREFENDNFMRVQTIAYHNEHLYVGSRDSNSTVVFKVTIGRSANNSAD